MKESVASDLVNLLHNNIVKVVFEKVNGEKRILFGTLRKKHIPEDLRPTGMKQYEKNPSVQRVFDTEISEWRSFRWDSLVDYEVVSR